MPHGAALHCGKNVDLAPNGEEKKPRALQELRRRRKELTANPGEGGRGNLSSLWPGWRQSAVLGSWLLGTWQWFKPHELASGVKEKLGQPVATHSEWRIPAVSLHQEVCDRCRVPHTASLGSKEKNSVFFHRSSVYRCCPGKHLWGASIVRPSDCSYSQADGSSELILSFCFPRQK